MNRSESHRRRLLHGPLQEGSRPDSILGSRLPVRTSERGIGHAGSGLVYSGDEDLQFQLLYLSHAVPLSYSRKCSIVNVDSVRKAQLWLQLKIRGALEGHMSRDLGPTAARREVPRPIHGSIYRSIFKPPGSQCA